MSLNEVKTEEDFFAWFAEWSDAGDSIEVEVEAATGDKEYKVYNGCQYLIAEFSNGLGLKTYK